MSSRAVVNDVFFFFLFFVIFFSFQSGNVPSSVEVDKAEKKLQENEDLMKRLTGIWEDKWSKTQKLIEVMRFRVRIVSVLFAACF